MTGLTWDDRDDRDDMGAEVNISPKNEYFYTYPKNGAPFSRKKRGRDCFSEVYSYTIPDTKCNKYSIPMSKKLITPTKILSMPTKTPSSPIKIPITPIK